MLQGLAPRRRRVHTYGIVEPESLLRQPRPRAVERKPAGDFRIIFRAALEQFAIDIADDREAIETVCAVVRPLLGVYGEPIAVEQWRDTHGVISRRHLMAGGQEQRGLLIIDGMGHVLTQPRTAGEDEWWLLNAEARHHQVALVGGDGLLVLAWRPAGVLSRGKLSLDHWRAAVRPLTAAELIANYPVEAFLRGLQEALTRRVERSRHWTEFIRQLNEEFENLPE